MTKLYKNTPLQNTNQAAEKHSSCCQLIVVEIQFIMVQEYGFIFGKIQDTAFEFHQLIIELF